MYDIIIIGAGPAGISAGIYAVSRGKKTLVLEGNRIGGLIGGVSTVTHYTGIVSGETGASFAQRMEYQACTAGVEIHFEKVTNVDLSGDIKRIDTVETFYEARKVIIANGSSPRKLGIEGEVALTGKGMGMKAALDAEKYRGRNMYVVGGADGAVKEALYLSRFAKELTIIHFEERLGCIAEFAEKVSQTANIRLCLGCRLQAVHGDAQVESLDILHEQTGNVETISDPGCGIFVYAGTVPNTGLYTQLRLQDGYIPVNEKMETELAGVYAVGDIRVKQVRQVATAVSDGAIAAINAAM